MCDSTLVIRHWEQKSTSKAADRSVRPTGAEITTAQKLPITVLCRARVERYRAERKINLPHSQSQQLRAPPAVSEANFKKTRNRGSAIAFRDLHPALESSDSP